jgi:DAACS family dicarboxylate/amino acid:cation (Na+ or H+) symporter
LFGLVIGAVVGLLFGIVATWQATESVSADAFVKQSWVFQILKLCGDVFLNGLKLIVIPLVTSSIVLAVSNIGANSGFGRMGLKTLLYYLSTSLFAILIGLALVNLMQPGVSAGAPLLDATQVDELDQAFATESKALSKSAENADVNQPVFEKLLDVFRRMVPSNLIAAAAEDNLLALIIASLLVGYFITKLSARHRELMNGFWQAVQDLSMRVTDFVLAFAPLGVGCLLAVTLAENYARLAEDNRMLQFFSSICWFTATTVIALALHFFIVLPLYLLVFTRRNPIHHFMAMGPALMTAFSTSSSNATLPVSIECVEERAGVSNKTASFVLPLGATVNMDGTALYECVAAIFIAQMFGADLSFSQQFFVVLVALMTSVGVAGVPSASLVAIMIILQSLSADTGLPLEKGLPILLVFDRLLDMLRTSVNVFSDSCGAVVVAASEGETNLYPRALASRLSEADG